MVKSDYLELELYTSKIHGAAIIRMVVDRMELSEITVHSWNVPLSSEPILGPCPSRSVLEGVFEKQEEQGSFYLNFSGVTTLSGFIRNANWIVRLTVNIGEISSEAYQSKYRIVKDIVYQFIDSSDVQKATVKRWAPSIKCIPVVPVVKDYQLILTTATEIEASYENCDAFYSLAWDKVEKIGDLIILERASYYVDNISFLKHIWWDQWTLARIAKPGLVKYYAVQLQEDEKPIFYQGEQLLHPSEYFADEKRKVYSASVSVQNHINGWEIFALREALQKGRTLDGEEVRYIDVIFVDRDMAACERRPLLDIGCRVFFFNDDGELAEWTES